MEERFDIKKLKEIFSRDQFAALTGCKIVEVGVGYAKVLLDVESKHLNAAGVVQGGALFTLADFAFAIASNSHGKLSLAINASIRFLKAVSSGSLIAVAYEESEPKKLGAYRVEIKDETGDPVALFEGMVYRKNVKLK